MIIALIGAAMMPSCRNNVDPFAACDLEDALRRSHEDLSTPASNWPISHDSQELLNGVLSSINIKNSLTGTEERTIAKQFLSDVPEPTEDASPGLYTTPEGLSAPFPIEAVHWSGDPAYRLNLVILGDGYRSEELGDFRSAAANLKRQLLARDLPFRDYANFINIVRMDVASAESGASCDDRQLAKRKNRYGSAFVGACMNALFKNDEPARSVYQLNFKRVTEDAQSVLYNGKSIVNQVHVFVHSKLYGGMTLSWSSSTDGAGPHTAVHEIGHAWGELGDEYALKGDPCLFFMAKAPNVSTYRESRDTVKWKQWVIPGTEIPTPEKQPNVIGLFQGAGGGCQKVLYRPALTCKMNSNEAEPFCPVCSEALILKLYERAKPIQSEPRSNEEIVDASVTHPERLKTRWLLNGKTHQESEQYEPFRYAPKQGDLVQLLVFDAKAPVRRDFCSLFFATQKRF